ncbi:universal stress protein [Candidatus Magnetomonas plexicatena]|uniref:universal stress protein n=1 Tax=Candidatus Magnetomonas plexicatena TaxID=2552947 RepID=UPI001C77F84B|nr:universal stress protein [Nitrospirales bacterium LBB_01]
MDTSKMEVMYRQELMGELKSILLAVDGSDYSKGAVDEGILLAKSCGIKLTMLYVQGLNDGFETGGMTFVESMDRRLDDYFDNTREKAADENVEMDIIIRRTSDAFRGIVDEAYEKSSDIIIMGRRGMTGLKRMIMGSVTAKVLAYAPCKVLVVPKEAEIRGDHIMLATDGSKFSEAAEREAINMAARCPFVKTFHAVSVASTKERMPEALKNLDRVKTKAANRGVTVETLALVGEPYKAVVNASMETGTDLVIMGSHGRTGLEKLLMGSVAERVVALAPCSVLVVKTGGI